MLWRKNEFEQEVTEATEKGSESDAGPLQNLSEQKHAVVAEEENTIFYHKDTKEGENRRVPLCLRGFVVNPVFTLPRKLPRFRRGAIGKTQRPFSRRGRQRRRAR
jgi:hypothetical protein